MALNGAAPKIFRKCTKSGVPYVAVGSTSCFIGLAFLKLSSSGGQVFVWFINFLNSGCFISWICVCVVYLRFRKAVTAQGITELP